ncbi:protein translocase subunit SecF [Candidatus Woesearchaeota archaeon]|nr:protein translocase subunit SecF [Candidatus Woesearchaeota archaeon]
MSKKKLRREMARLRALGLQKTSSTPEATHPEPEAMKVQHMPKLEPSAKKGWKAWLMRLYEQDYKKLTYFTIIILFLAIVQIGYQMATTGDFINKGVSLKGGITVTIANAAMSPQAAEEFFRDTFPQQDIAVRGITSTGGAQGLIIDADMLDPDKIAQFRTVVEETFKVTSDDYNVEEIGSALGSSFFKQVILSLLVAFVLMALMVIIWFRNFGPSMIVILAAFCDLIETVAVINLLGIKVSTGGVAALLMLVGYSVDTDILLSTRVLKRKEGTVFNATVDAFKTGMLMTLTSLAAVTVGYLVSSSDVLRQIMLILLIGLFFDMFNTWIQNAALLRWYLEHQERKKAARGGA